MTERPKSTRGNLRRECHDFETQEAALEFLSRRLAGAGSDKTAVSLTEGSLTVTLEDGHKTIYRLCGLQVTIEQRIKPVQSRRRTLPE